MGRKTNREKINEKIGAGVQKFNENTVKKLEEAFEWDCTINEACLHAGISKQCYYDNVNDNQKLIDRFTELRESPVLLARRTAIAKLPESYQNAMDYLKRKKKLEFGDGMDITSGGKPIVQIDNAIVKKNETA